MTAILVPIVQKTLESNNMTQEIFPCDPDFFNSEAMVTLSNMMGGGNCPTKVLPQ